MYACHGLLPRPELYLLLWMAQVIAHDSLFLPMYFTYVCFNAIAGSLGSNINMLAFHVLDG
jgi:hypothetical protein